MQEPIRIESTEKEIRNVFFSPMEKWRDLFRKRFEFLKRHNGLTQEALAELMDVSQGTIGHWLNSRRTPENIETFYKLAESLGLPRDAFLAETSEETIYKAISTDETLPGYIRLQLLNVNASAGAGTLVDKVDVVDHIDVLKEWALEKLGTLNAIRHIKLLTASGVSMVGAGINNGDILLVDTNINRYVGDGIYVFTFQDGFSVKELRANEFTQRLEIISFPHSGEKVIASLTKEETHQLYIQGRVKYWWNLRGYG